MSKSNGSQPPTDLLPVVDSQKETDHPCFECTMCCDYVALEIDEPTTMKEYDYLLWYLYHRGVTVFVDWDGDWYIKFESRCKNLMDNGLCEIYEERPAICRDFHFEDCERHNTDEPADKWLFESSDAFLTWFEKQRPRTFQKFQAFRRQQERRKTSSKLRRLKVTDLPLAPPRS